jgi:hypothetical protein
MYWIIFVTAFISTYMDIWEIFMFLFIEAELDKYTLYFLP